MSSQSENSVAQQRLDVIAEHLDIDAGFVVTVEHPGCVVIPHSDGSGRSWWFGTANTTWQGDLCALDGAYLGVTLDTGVPATEADPGKIAVAIADLMFQEPSE